MARIVVIGRSGQVATELRHQPLPDGWDLIGLGRDRLDLAQPENFKAVLAEHKPDILINAAAYTAVDQAEIEEDLATLVNGTAPGRLAKAAADFGIPFLHISTDYVFDGTSPRPWSEDSAPNPLNAYGRSKLAGERAVCDSAARAVIVRTSWVFSPFGSNFVKAMVRLAEIRQDIPVVADQHGGPTSADSIARALIGIARSLDEGGDRGQWGIFHFSGRPATTWFDFAEAIFDNAVWIKNRPKVTAISTEQYNPPAKRPLNSVLDCSRLARVFEIKQPDWHDGLKRTLAALAPARE